MSILNFIGNTPLMKIQNQSDDLADIYVKLEFFNPGGSIKTRVAARMIENAEREGILHKGSTIIEATGGNTGIGLAIVSNVKGYKFIAVVPDNYSKERIDLLKIYGANVVLADSKQGNDSHIMLVKKMVRNNPEYIWLNQFENKASIEAHYEGTGKEIVNQIIPDAFVASVGSAGTFQGIANCLKFANPKIKLYVAQPKGCDLKNGTSIPHRVQGVSLGIKPPLLDYNMIEGYIDVEFNEIKSMLYKMIRNEGIFLGISAGENIVAAYKIAKELGRGKVVCTIAPDSGNCYINEGIYDVM